MDAYCQELHQAYQDIIAAFARSYPRTDKELIRQIDMYSHASAMFLWNYANAEIDACVDAINVLYSEISESRPAYTFDNISSAMQKLSTHNYSLPVPEFFNRIIAYDRRKGTNYSSRLAECFEILDIFYAMIDGRVEEAEADLIIRMDSRLRLACDNCHIRPFSTGIDPRQYVDSPSDAQLVVTAAKGIYTYNQDLKPPKRSTGSGRQAGSRNSQNKKADTDHAAQTAMNKLDGLIGLTNVKKEIHEIEDFAVVQKARKMRGLPVSEMSFHLVFTGNPGTGKTTVARLVAQIYKDLGIVSKGQLKEVSAKDLIAGYIGQTAIKTGEVIEEAIGGVLFIDEAYSLLDDNGRGYGQEAVDTLLKEMEDHRNDLAVIVAGYDDRMHQFINSNPGLKSRFNRYVHFDDYTADELYLIFEKFCEKGQYKVSPQAHELVRKHLTEISANPDDSFANGRTVRNIFENIISKQASRIASADVKTKDLLTTIEADDVRNGIGDEEHKGDTLEEALEELNSLTGLDTVKEEISELVYVVKNQQRRKAQGLKVPRLSLHLVFMGSPGTGKTTVARCVARIYKCLGLLSRGQLIETDRSGLVAGYVGQTAIKTQEVAKSAVGGVLFIDEAYTLSNGGPNDFGQEAIDTLLKVMEDERDNLVVIVAGYDELMEKFIHSNPGLESRFNRYIHFDDYSPDEMLAIFKDMCVRNQYRLTDSAETAVRIYFERTDASTIGNGRGVRNLFEKVLTQQARRVGEAMEEAGTDLTMITEGDISTALMKGLPR